MTSKESLTIWPCPAKLNLFLHFVGQREDGYHLLQSVFQIVDFGDNLAVTPNAQDEVTFECNVAELTGQNNLVVKAAKELQAQAKLKNPDFALGANLQLVKKLPAGGGIGGGSSDCATTLVALNYLWNLNFSTEQLADIGLKLGADVPIFIHGNTAFVEGIGEKITPLEVPEAWYLVVYPECHVSTAKIFSNPLLTRNSKAITIRDLNALELPFKGNNSMQTLVCNDYPAVDSALSWLKNESPSARMSGSGSCLFAAFDNEQEVRKIASRCEWPHFVARGTNKSPLQQKLLQLMQDAK